VAKNAQSTTDHEVGYELNQDSTMTGKGRPTPTRREKERARKQPLVSNDRAAAKRQSRAAMNVERERQRIGLANGEEKYLPARDRGAQKRYVRDYIDARFSLGEALIPVMIVVILLTFVPVAEVQVVGMLLLYVFFAAAVIDAVIIGAKVRGQLTAKYGDATEKVRWYAAMRSFQMRPMRLPKPQVKRGNFPTL
jgi:hypothetical protein